MPLDGMQEAIDELDEKSNMLVRALALEGISRIVLRTPVRTGRARGNWHLSKGSPVRSVDDPSSYSEPEGEGGASLPPVSAGAGQEAVERGRTKLAAFRIGDTLYITNALPYIDALEDGHSQQAPNGMIALTVDDLEPLVDQIAAQIQGGALG